MAKVKQKNIDVGALTKVRKKAPPRPVKRKDLQTVYRAHLKEVDIEALKKPWMATKEFKLLDTEPKLRAWVDSILASKDRWIKPYVTSEPMPVIAVDTETIGLDTRILTHYELQEHVTGNKVLIPIYEVKAEIAGVVLSADGITGVYIPINHQDCLNVSRTAANYHLQRLFDVSHLVFYNAKFDREVMRLTLAINFRDYPFYEDVQVLNYINDPKADLGDDTFVTDGAGLKGLAKLHFNIEQISLASITKVKAWKPNYEKVMAQIEADAKALGDTPSAEDIKSIKDRKRKASSTNVQHVPFTWVPTHIAVWYAAADGICTWLLWDKLRHEAQSRRVVHNIDGNLIDTITWIERQRTLADVKPVARISKWHVRTMEERKEKLRLLAIEDGWIESTDDDGNVIDDTLFDVGKPQSLAKLLYEIKKLKVVKRTPGGPKSPPRPSTDADALLDLRKLYPQDKFLKELENYKEYVSLHPEKLSFDPHDNSLRIYIKQSRVAGGRLAASGGNFDRDGGQSMNPQAIKSVGGNWWVTGNVLDPDHVNEADVIPYEEKDLHPSCIKEADEDVIIGWKETVVDENENVVEHIYPDQFPADKYDLLDDDPGMNRVAVTEKRRVRKIAPGIINNHIGNYLGYAICLVPECTSCAKKFGILIEHTKLDCNQIVNFRQFFIAQPGWTYFTSDYSGIEMVVAANISGEPKYIKEFLEGSGDFHTLTASMVFPEFNTPGITKARKKELRSLAKIINFALQYGGTEYTIFSNMKKQKPDITWEEAKQMVRAYWAGVPVYKAFYDEKQRIAREEMICSTVFGRVVKFESQMASLGIHKPIKEEMDNYWDFLRVRKQFKIAEQDNDVELMKTSQATMDRLYKDPLTGVRNAQEYNKFMGKIQRVAANIPSQGTAGDFMRIALNFIRNWATKIEPMVQSVFQLHSSVHDEVDYTVKNEYVPFVVPRVTRLMRLRRLHATQKWPVPIECDTEYGPSWDVKHHTTGDAEHAPDAWTNIAGMEDYLPTEFDKATLDSLLRALTSEKPAIKDKAAHWLEENLHERAFEVAGAVFNAKDDKERRKRLIAILQLHEYWTVDQHPYDQDATMETLEQFEARCGLTAADRGFMPEMGYLGAVPLDRAIRPELPILLPEPPPTEEEITYAAYVVQRDIEKAAREAKKAAKDAGTEVVVAQLVTVAPPTAPPVKEEQGVFEFIPEMDTTVSMPSQNNVADILPPDVPPSEDEMFAPEPRKKIKPVIEVTPVAKLVNPDNLPVLRHMNPLELREFRAAMGIGTNNVRVFYGGREGEILDCSVTEVPANFLISN